jgi:hypothetical protein
MAKGAKTRAAQRVGGPTRVGPRVWRAAEEGVVRTVAGGAAEYDRGRSLPRLIGWDPFAPASDSDASGRTIRARLTCALRAERRRGRAGHWAYDLNRHLALLQALEGEAELLRRRPPPAGRT